MLAASAGEDGPWILRVPDRLTARFAKLSGERSTEVAQRWHRDWLDSGAAAALPPSRWKVTAADWKRIAIPAVLVTFGAFGWMWQSL